MTFAEAIQEKSGEAYPRPEGFYIVDSAPAFNELTRSEFLEDPLIEKEWENKRKENVVDFDKELLLRVLEKLAKHSILLVTGQQRVGKSTLLLYFIDECLKHAISPWRAFVFLDPFIVTKKGDRRGDPLDRIQDIIETELRQYACSEIMFVIDGLKRDESDRDCAEKCAKLFEWISSHKYKLIATLRDYQKSTLEETLKNREIWGRDKWSSFSIGEEKMEPPSEPYARFQRVRRLIISYLTFDHYRNKIRVPMGYDEPEFNECARILAEKSEGLVGYIVFLIEDMSISSHEFSRRTVEEYPNGMTRLVWNTIRRDYFVKGDNALPLLITFLAKQRCAVTRSFVKSLVHWGIDERSRDPSVNEQNQAKAGNLLTYHADKPVFQVKHGEIEQYRLKNLIRDAIEDGLSTNYRAQNPDELLNAFSEVNNNLESLITVGYFSRLQENLARGKLAPNDYATWHIIADIAKIWYIKALQTKTRSKVLEYATNFFVNNFREGFEEVKERDFLRRTISIILETAIDELSVQDCDSAIGFYRLACSDPDDYRSRWTLGRFLEKRNEDDEALKLYVESASIQNTSRGYGSLLEKLRSRKDRLLEGMKMEYLELREAVAIKAIECCAAEHRNWSDLAEALMHKGETLRRRKKFGESIKSYTSAAMTYEKALNVIGLALRSKGDKRRYLTRIAVIMGMRASAESCVGRLEESINDIEKAIELKKTPAIGEDTAEDERLLLRYRRFLVYREYVTPLLELILKLADLTVKGEEGKLLSDLWYDVSTTLDKIDPQIVGGNLEDLRNSALFQSLKLDETRARKPQMDPEIAEYSSKYHEDCARSIACTEGSTQVIGILHSCFAVLIETGKFYEDLRKGDIKGEKTKRALKLALSKRWSGVGRAIADNFLSIVPREAVIRSLELSVLICNDNAASWHNLGWQYLHDGRVDPALQAFAKSFKLKEEKRQKERLHLSKSGIGRAYGEKKDLVSSRSSFREGVDLCLKFQGKSDAQKSVAFLIKTAESLNGLVAFADQVNEKTEIMKDALDIYNRALEITQNARLPDVLLKLRELLLQKIRWQEHKVQWLEEKRVLPLLSLRAILETPLPALLSIRTEPERVETWVCREYAFHKLGGKENYEKSVECSDKILSMNPNNVFTYVNKAITLSKLGKHNEALECLEKVLETNDRNTFALFAKGIALLNLGKPEEALKYFERALSLVSATLSSSDESGNTLTAKKAQILSQKGYALSEVGDYDNAIACEDEAIRLDPWNQSPWQNKVYAMLVRALKKETSHRSVLQAIAELVKDALNKIEDHNKRRFLANVRNSAIHSIKKAVFEDCISSREDLTSLLNEFEKSIGQLIKTPSLDEIEEICRLDKRYAENKDKVARIFGLQSRRGPAEGQKT
jgi:tetratricopeptide (TPR) repeat protein